MARTARCCPGEYEVVFTLTGDPDAPLTLEAVAGNQQMLDTVTATGAQELRLHFSIDEPDGGDRVPPAS